MVLVARWGEYLVKVKELSPKRTLIARRENCIASFLMLTAGFAENLSWTLYA
jgi:hypothetical protein